MFLILSFNKGTLKQKGPKGPTQEPTLWSLVVTSSSGSSGSSSSSSSSSSWGGVGMELSVFPSTLC